MNLITILKSSLIFTFLVCMSGCSDSTPSTDALGEDEMVELLVDIHMADAILAVSNFKIKRDTVVIEHYYNDVLKKHHTTQKQIENSIKYYSKKPRKFEKIYVQVSDKLSKMESGFQQKGTAKPDSTKQHEFDK